MPPLHITSPASSSSSRPVPARGAHIEDLSRALCKALEAHRPSPIIEPSEQGIAAIRDALLDDVPEAHRTAELVASLQRASERLAYGLANFSHRALKRAHAELESTLAPFAVPGVGPLMSCVLVFGAHALKGSKGDSQLHAILRDRAAQVFDEAVRGVSTTDFDAALSLRPNDVTPLPRLSMMHPSARQTLDQERGHVLVRFPGASMHDAMGTTETRLKIPAISNGNDASQRASQDAALDTLDRFCAASFGDSRSLWSLRPPAITLDAPSQTIRVGDLPVATLTQGVWSMDADAASHIAVVLDPNHPQRERAVHEWTGPTVPLAPSRCRPGQRDLRLLLQLEDDRIIRNGAASRQLRHPDESVWIQVDANGRQRIIAGEALLTALPADARIKVEVHGHGGRLGFSDHRALARRSPPEIAGVLRETMDGLGLSRPIDAVDLASCALATPVFPKNFAKELLVAGHHMTLFRPETEVTAYADVLSFKRKHNSLKQVGHRLTKFSASSAGDIHAPGKSLAYSLERGTGKLIVRDKHPEVEPGRPAARPATRSHEAYPAEDASDLPSVSPWGMRGPTMAI